MLKQAEDIFHQSVLPYGGRLHKDEADDVAWDILEQQISFFREFIGDGLDVPENFNPPGPIHIDYVSNSSLNAFAFQREKHEFVGLFVGAVLYIYDAFMVLLSHPEVLSDIGNPHLETTSDDRIAEYLKRNPTGHFAEIGPKDTIRQQVARYLAFNVTNFIFGHEVGHIVDAHLFYLKKHFGMDWWTEYSDLHLSMTAIKNTGHLLEFGADRHGVRISLNTWGRLCEGGTISSIKDPNLYLRVWAFSLGVIFRLFDRHTRDVNEYDRSSHPRPDLRYYQAIVFGTEIVQELVPNLKEVFISSTSKASKELNALWKRFNIPSKSFDLFDESVARKVGELYEQFYDFQSAVLLPLQLERSKLVRSGID